MISLIIVLSFLVTYAPCAILLWKNTDTDDCANVVCRIIINLIIFGPGVNVLMSIVFLVFIL